MSEGANSDTLEQIMSLIDAVADAVRCEYFDRDVIANVTELRDFGSSLVAERDRAVQMLERFVAWDTSGRRDHVYLIENLLPAARAALAGGGTGAWSDKLDREDIEIMEIDRD